MNILIYDTEISKNDIYDLLSKHLNINFIKTKTREEFMFCFEDSNDNDLIIVDVSFPIGEEIFNYITKLNQKRKIIVLSKTLSYNHTFTCFECEQLFNRKLLLKPINVALLIKYIKNFDKLICKYSSDSNEIAEIMDDILEQFVHYYYDTVTKKILKRIESNSNVNEFIRITELLAIHNIRYEIEQENIKLHF